MRKIRGFFLFELTKIIIIKVPIFENCNNNNKKPPPYCMYIQVLYSTVDKCNILFAKVTSYLSKMSSDQFLDILRLAKTTVYGFKQKICQFCGD